MASKSRSDKILTSGIGAEEASLVLLTLASNPRSKTLNSAEFSSDTVIPAGKDRKTALGYLFEVVESELAILAQADASKLQAAKEPRSLLATALDKFDKCYKAPGIKRKGGKRNVSVDTTVSSDNNSGQALPNFAPSAEIMRYSNSTESVKPSLYRPGVAPQIDTAPVLYAIPTATPTPYAQYAYKSQQEYDAACRSSGYAAAPQSRDYYASQDHKQQLILQRQQMQQQKELEKSQRMQHHQAQQQGQAYAGYEAGGYPQYQTQGTYQQDPRYQYYQQPASYQPGYPQQYYQHGYPAQTQFTHGSSRIPDARSAGPN